MTSMSTAIGVAAGGIVMEALGAARAAITAFFEDSIGGAMKMERITRILGNTFGYVAKKVVADGEAMAEATGFDKSSILQGAEQFGVFALKAGKSREEAARFAAEMSQLAAEVQSANPEVITFAEAQQKLFLGLEGATRGLKGLGVVISEDDVAAEALSLGYKKVNDAFTESALGMARASLITKELSLAHGDLASRTGSASLTAQQTSGRYKRLAEDIGAFILPVYKAWIFAQDAVSRAIAAGFAAAKPYLESFGRTAYAAWDSFKVGAAAVAASVVEMKTVLISGLLPALGLVFLGLPGMILGGLVALQQFPGAVDAIRGACSAALSFLNDLAGGMLGAGNMATVAGAALTILGGVFFGLPGAIIGAVVAFTAFGGAIQEWVIDKAELVGIAWRNLPAIFEVAVLQISEKIVNLGEYMATIPGNLQIIANYVANNWRSLIVDGVNAVITVFKNLGENLINLGAAIGNFLLDPTKGFHFEWKGLLTDFKAVSAELPKMIEAQLSDFSPQIAEKLKGIADAETARNKRLVDEAKAKTEPTARNISKQAEGKTKEFKSETSGLAEFAGKLRESIFSKADDTPRKQLEATERTAKAGEETRDLLKNGIAAKMA